jgi:hypothetical protein
MRALTAVLGSIRAESRATSMASVNGESSTPILLTAAPTASIETRLPDAWPPWPGRMTPEREGGCS